ncbi:MAG: hypothetical protein M3542_09565 [Acidobacteriota bacterium]|nr:hypothetical protein [Acidobacteriota bacterium]MDQ5872145.1 hypothetical protein [Acidobacteriota bacterium]
MKKSLVLRIGFLSLVTALFAVGTVSAGGSGVNVTIDGDRNVESCGDIRIRYDRSDAERAESAFTLPGGAPFKATMPANSGVYVIGEKRGDFAVTACKAARRADDLGEIRVTPQGSGVAFQGPSGGDWLVFLIVRAPRDAAVDLEVNNGSISVRDTSGNVTARTTNGPISLSNSSGVLEANAVNGPISLKGCTGSGKARAVNGPIDFEGSQGTYRLDTQNGPISVELEGDRWDGGSLDARAVNGPLSLKLAEGYRSGVLVEMSGNGPVSCPAAACEKARKVSNDDSRRIEFGDGDPVVRLSTRNGPVSIHSKH